VRLAHAITRLVDADQPVRLNATTSRYLQELMKLEDYRWLQGRYARLQDAATAGPVANQIRSRDPELNALLRTTVSPALLNAGVTLNMIPNTAEAGLDVRRLPNETAEEILARFRQIVNDGAVEVIAGLEEMPATEPSSLTSPLYLAMERVMMKSHPRAIVVPYMARGATDGAFLRQKGMAVYGAPVFEREGEGWAHANDERISVRNLQEGTELLWRVVAAAAGSAP
jgi:acetylornithine deacetylase/succinyl-diaminopimelate desuccinylase-like protein